MRSFCRTRIAKCGNVNMSLWTSEEYFMLHMYKYNTKITIKYQIFKIFACIEKVSKSKNYIIYMTLSHKDHTCPLCIILFAK